MDKNEKIFMAIDIGSTKIVALMGRNNQEGKIEIIGMGHSMSNGIKRGVVFNIEESHAAISNAIEQAEKESGYKASELFVNISGNQMQTLTTTFDESYGQDHCLTEADIEQIAQSASQISIEKGMTIYHTNPKSYTIDNEQHITNPIGAIGDKVVAEFKVHIAPESYQRYINMCLIRSKLKIQKAILDPIASSEVILTEEEKEKGVALIDFGGGTSKVSIFHNGVLCHTSMVPFGGNLLTADIKEGCVITLKQAESLKLQFGKALSDFAVDKKMITIPVNGWEPKQISEKQLANIIQARAAEIIHFFNYEIAKSGYVENLGAGIVLTGGSSLLPHIGQLISFITGYDVRIGIPNMNLFTNTSKFLNNPKYATVLGLLKMASEEAIPGKKVKRKKPKEQQGPGTIDIIQKKLVNGVLSFFNEPTTDVDI